MFERDNSVFAGVVFTLDTHNQILRTGCHTAVAAIGNVGKYHVNDSTVTRQMCHYLLILFVCEYGLLLCNTFDFASSPAAVSSPS